MISITLFIVINLAGVAIAYWGLLEVGKQDYKELVKDCVHKTLLKDGK